MPSPGCLLRGDGNRTQQTVAVGVVFLFRRIRAGPLVQQFPKGVILIESSVFRRTVAGNPELVVVSGIKPAGQGILLQNIDTGDLLRRIARPVQGRQQYGCQDRNDRNDNQKFNQCKPIRLHSAPPADDWAFSLRLKYFSKTSRRGVVPAGFIVCGLSPSCSKLQPFHSRKAW